MTSILFVHSSRTQSILACFYLTVHLCPNVGILEMSMYVLSLNREAFALCVVLGVGVPLTFRNAELEVGCGSNGQRLRALAILPGDLNPSQWFAARLTPVLWDLIPCSSDFYGHHAQTWFKCIHAGCLHSFQCLWPAISTSGCLWRLCSLPQNLLLVSITCWEYRGQHMQSLLVLYKKGHKRTQPNTKHRHWWRNKRSRK